MTQGVPPLNSLTASYLYSHHGLTRSAAKQGAEEIVVADLATFECNFNSVHRTIATASNTQRRARFERTDHLDRFDSKRSGNMARRVAADYGDALHPTGGKHFAQNAP
jgi:hypothetical protein